MSCEPEVKNFRTHILLILQFFPVFHCPAGVRNHNGSANQVRYRKNLENLIGCHAKFVAFSQMIFDAIVAAKHHRRNQAKHFLGFGAQSTVLVGQCVDTVNAFHYFVICRHDFVVHPGAVVVKIVDKFAHI